MEFLKRLWKKNEEIIMYVIVGGCTTLVSLVSYYIFAKFLGLHYQAANVISWIFAVAFAYVTNKKYVFKSAYKGVEKTLKEAAGFVSSRLASLFIELICMYIGVRLLQIDDGIMKLIDQVIVFVLNYVFSKFLVFRKQE